MSAIIGSKIPRNGLVFGYDMSNTKKSWMGTSTTNLLYDSGVFNSAFESLTSTITVTAITPNSRYKITSNSASAGTCRLLVPLSKLVNGTNYNLSFKWKAVAEPASFTMSDWCDQPLNSHTVTDYGTYKFATAYSSRSTYDSSYRFMDFVIGAYTSIEIWDIQLEVGIMYTRFTNGNRTQTESILDLTKTATLTPNSLSYPSPEKFAFNAGYISVPWHAGMDFSKAITIVQWIKPTHSVWARRNPYNQAYGGPGTITYEPAKNFNYFYGTNGGDGSPYAAITSTFTVDINEWAMIVVTRDNAAGLTKWYKNGVFSNQSTANGYASCANGTNPILIGDGYVDPFIGEIPMTLAYNRALSADEILNLYYATRSRIVGSFT